MDWNTQFIIYRVGAGAKLEEVFRSDDMKKSKYWLTYIAQLGDVMCRTPRHPKHKQASAAPEYFAHKSQSGVTASDENQWKTFAQEKGWDSQFPQKQDAVAPSEQ